MKAFKKIFAVVFTVVMIVTLSGMKDVKAYADGPVTWTVYYDDVNSAWAVYSDRLGFWTVYVSAVEDYMIDGDNIVVDTHNVTTAPKLELVVSKRVGQAVAANGAVAYIKAPAIESAYVATSGTLIAEAPTVDFVKVYPDHIVQILGNVNKFEAHYEYNSTKHPRFGVSGTVKEAYVNYTGSIFSADKPIYNVAANKLNSDENGEVKLLEGQYSLTPTAAEEPAKKKQLDAVPKTGDIAIPESLVFIMLAAVFAVGAVAFKKKLQ